MTTSSANQFIGSKISLISKSEIRYEGILYSLDLQDATISLAKVKSFGTEDRPTERPVPPKEEVYEFIIFRGADIKGIDVLEPPKAAPTLMTSGLPNDPAIVEVSHYHSGQSGGIPPNVAPFTGSSGSGYPGSFGTSVLGGVKPTQSTNSELHSSSLEQTSGISVPFEPTESIHETSRSNASTPTLYSNRKSPTIDSGAQVPDDSRGKNSRQYNNNRQGGDGRRSRQSSEDRRRHQNRQSQGGQVDRQQQQSGYQPRGRGQYVNYRGGFRGGRGGNRGGYRPQGIIQAQMPPKVTFNDPYDFDKANEELQNVFSKLKLAKSTDEEKKEGGEPEQDGGEANNVEQEEQENKEPAEPFYVKDSFYDKISCESTERSKGKGTRIDWRAERKLNAETFGVPVNNGQRRGGGGFRGFRGGYGYRGNTGGYQQRGGWGYNSGYGNSGYYQYNNRYNGGRGQRGGYRQQQQQQPSQQQQQQQQQQATQ